MATTTYTATIDNTTIEVSVSPDPDTASGYVAQVRIDGRPAWTARHTDAYSDGDDQARAARIATSALTLLHHYLAGYARLQTPAVDHRHEWRGWAEVHADAVRLAKIRLLDGEASAATDDTEVWTVSEVAAWWGIAESAVSSTMARCGVPVYDREPGRGGRSRYQVVLVRRARADAPGRGGARQNAG